MTLSLQRYFYLKQVKVIIVDVVVCDNNVPIPNPLLTVLSKVIIRLAVTPITKSLMTMSNVIPTGYLIMIQKE